MSLVDINLNIAIEITSYLLRENLIHKAYGWLGAWCSVQECETNLKPEI